MSDEIFLLKISKLRAMDNGHTKTYSKYSIVLTCKLKYLPYNKEWQRWIFRNSFSTVQPVKLWSGMSNDDSKRWFWLLACHPMGYCYWIWTAWEENPLIHGPEEELMGMGLLPRRQIIFSHFFWFWTKFELSLPFQNYFGFRITKSLNISFF